MSQPTGKPLGVFLRSAREAKNMTLEQVASQSRVNLRQLQTLEADDYSHLPAKPFLRGFVISYCRAVGLDPREVLTEYRDFLEERSSERPRRDLGHKGYLFERREGDRQRIYLWATICIFVGLGATAFLVFQPKLASKRKKIAEKLANVTLPHSSQASLSAQSSIKAQNIASASSESSSVGASSSSGPVTAAASSVSAPPPATSSRSSQKLESSSALSPASLSPSSSSISSLISSSAAAQASSGSSERKRRADPFFSGVDLFPEEVKHKIRVRATEDVWVRFKMDGKPTTSFPLRKGIMLVLKAGDALRFQVSHLDRVEVEKGSGGFKPGTAVSGFSKFRDTDTLVLGNHIAGQDPFSDSAILSKTIPQGRRPDVPTEAKPVENQTTPEVINR